LIARAAGLFVATNVDSFVLLLAFFSRAAGSTVAALRVVAGELLGFVAILVVCVTGALGLQLVAKPVIPYLGLVPLMLGLLEAWKLLRRRGGDQVGGDPGGAVGLLPVAAATLATGGDNVSAYIPLFASAGPDLMVSYSVLFLIGVVAICGAAWLLCGWPPVARATSRVGELLLPLVLVAIGVIILVEGHAFGW
jgi:cadmium resistance protein CadD (predicted permease)